MQLLLVTLSMVILSLVYFNQTVKYNNLKFKHKELIELYQELGGEDERFCEPGVDLLERKKHIMENI